MTSAFDATTFDATAFEARPVGWVDLGQNSTINAVSTAYGRTINSLTEWNGRIYIGYGDYDGNVPDPITLAYWDESGEEYGSAGNFDSCATHDWRIVNGELWACASDETGDAIAKITSSHSVSKVTDGTLGDSSHVFDAIYFNGQPMVCGANNKNSGNCSQGTVWRYNGSSWSEADTAGANCPGGTGVGVNRIYGMFVISGTLYAKTNGVAVRTTTDGTTWSNGSGLSASQVVHPLPVSGGVMYRTTHWPPGTSSSLIGYSGSAESVLLSSGVYNHVLAPDSTPYVLRVVSGTREIAVGNAAGTSWTQVDNTIPSNSTALCVTDDAFYIGTADSHLWRCYF